MEGRHVSLDGEWKIRRATRVEVDGERLSRPGHDVEGWISARVPGTVLGAMVEAGVYPDPWEASNGAATADPAPDAAAGNAGTYTFWWLRDFELAPPSSGERYWLDFHGVNHRADVYVNGKRVGQTAGGMFRRHSLDVTAVCHKGTNRVALLVVPPVGEGAGGGPVMGYAEGRDWIPPVADRNTGPWAGVELRVTGPIRLNDPRVVTYVVGADGEVADKATLMLGAEVHNAGDEEELATLTAHLVDTGQVVERDLRLPPGERTQAALEDLDLMYPHLWWPRGSDETDGTDGAGPPPLYTVELLLNVEGVLSDRATVRFGVREVSTRVDEDTGGRVLSVNGRDVFVDAADWTGTDALLRHGHLSPQRYRDEVRLHAEFGVNLLRVRGDGMVERPDFYAACDELGVMVVQDFPRSREGAGVGEGEEADAFLDCARDSVKVLRNHPSLVAWSGGDGLAGADAAAGGDRIDHCLRCHVTGRDEDGDPCRFSGAEACGPEGVLDGTRPYLRSSADVFRGMARVSLAGGAEAGSEGTAEGAAAEETDGGVHADGAASMVAAQEAVGEARARMWRPHTGLHLGRVQGPWPGMEGTLYDWHLRQRAAYFGARRALQPVALLLEGAASGGEDGGEGGDSGDAGDGGGEAASVRLVNGGGQPVAGTLVATAHDLEGRELARLESELSAEASGASEPTPLDWPDAPAVPHFLTLELHPVPGGGEEEGDGEAGEETAPLTRSRYWRSGAAPSADLSPPDLSPLNDLPWVELKVSATVERVGEVYALRARLRNPADTPAFAVELHLLPGDAADGDGAGDGAAAVSPAFYSDNLFTLLPGEEREVVVRCSAEAAGGAEPVLEVGGWNVDGARGFGPSPGAA